MTNAIGIALSGLHSASTKLNASANNIANTLSVGSLDGSEQAPYTAQTTVSYAQDSKTGGVLTKIVPKDPGFIAAYAPNSPLADENGVVGVPNADYAEDIVHMKFAELSYKANIGVIKTASEMSKELLSLFDKKV